MSRTASPKASAGVLQREALLASGIPVPPAPARLDAPRSAWRVAGPLLLVVIAGLLLAYRGTALGMAAIWWRSETFTHAILVVPASLWLVWRRRSELAALVPSPSPAWLAGIAAAAVAWLFGELADTNAITQFALVAMVVMAVPAVLGTAVARRIMFPLGFLFFAVPIGEFTMPLLMEWTADVTVSALRLTGIPVYREGQLFHIPSGAWSVVEACSGVRYLIASVMIGTLFAYLNFTSLARRWAFVGVAILVPVIANWLRAYLIVMLGHLSNNRLAVGFDHIVYGWVFFCLVMAVMFTIGIGWREPVAAIAGEAPVPPSRPVPPRHAGAFAVVAAAVLLLAVLPRGAMVMTANRSSAQPVALDLGMLAADWQPTVPVADWRPAFVAPTARFDSAWRHDGHPTVDLSVVWYRDQGEGHRLVSSVNDLVTSTDPAWRKLDVGRQAVRFTHGSGVVQLDVPATTLAGAPVAGRPSRLLVWQFYWVDDELPTSDVDAKLIGIRQRLLRHRDDGAAIFLSTPDDGSGTAARTLGKFVGDSLPTLLDRLKAARDAR